MHIGSTWDVIELTPPERLLGGMVEMAVLAAAPGGPERLASDAVRRAARRLVPDGRADVVEAYISSLCAGTRKDDRWRQELAAGMEGMPESRLRTLLADLCVESGLVRDIRAASGPVVRRLDAICDLAQVSFAVADVRAAYAGLVADLTAAAEGVFVSGAFAAGEAAFATYVGGSFGRAELRPAPTAAGADLHAVARLLNAVLGAADCELPGLCDVVAVRSELHEASAFAAGAPERALLGWALGFAAAAAAA